MQWMQDFEVFQAAISSDHSYTSTLTNSLSLALDEFYKNLKSVGVSSVSGAGIEAYFTAIEESAQEFMETYKYCLPLIKLFLIIADPYDWSVWSYFHIYAAYYCLCRADLDKRRAEKQRLEEERQKENINKLRKDMEKSKGDTVVLNTGLKDREARIRAAMMDEDEVQEEDIDEDDDFERLSEEEDVIDEDEDEVTLHEKDIGGMVQPRETMN